VRYGFVIDQRKCIGCHACTVACKEENQVPLGAFRTWVKYVERGTFPNTRRYFSVLRCNHCDNAPCVTICPTVALYRRPDGVVDFDGARCIGCKSCMQACPYDALYIEPATHTAAKCNYCAHRLEVGLEPACVIVCPERAIIAGDLDDPRTGIARLVATEQVQVRKPEQGTRPKVFYLGGDAAALTPSLQAPAATYMWAQRPAAEVSLVKMLEGLGAGSHGDGALARPVYDVPHVPRPWGWKVSAYLWTKSIAAGVLLVAALAIFLQLGGGGWLSGSVAPLLALVFLAITTGLLVFDLKRPERFLFILLKPNPRSWLVWGAFILLAYGVVATAWLVVGWGGDVAGLRVLALPAVLLAAAAAGYSAFLFGQAEGRDFWQSPLVLPQLLVSAVVAGAATLLIVEVIGRRDPTALGGLSAWLLLGVLAHGVVVLIEVFAYHPSLDAARAARLITRGHYRMRFWAGVIVMGALAPVLLIAGFASTRSSAGVDSTMAVVLLLSSVLALGGLWLWEDLWVKAGQSIPLS
jgi:Fe-S-cluster-containing dehydrogenase component/formate-dependent nitrite reductase membrane component NrfD